ncbi:hypothetical protein KR215_011172 [Drosophila sulfurigaster]|nr:hypothetical protein KR215_011172 [Drosophila sulfurigaster]
MRTSNLRHIIVCLLIVSFASQSLAQWNRYAHRNLDSYYLATFKDHLRYLHDNLDYLTLKCCRQNWCDKSATCDPIINLPATSDIQKPSCKYAQLVNALALLANEIYNFGVYLNQKQ